MCDVYAERVLVLIRFKKVTRHWKILGRRAVAGRLVKESYGSAKQQHTFIVVRLCFQCWNGVAERHKVLAEKHKRGEATRRPRTMKKSKMTWSENGGMRRVCVWGFLFLKH
ncbi:hypothetical protein POTOM_026964 [Populus tomentosa]|uniref:DUF7699 domain-containing protein n=1 Tax=Populus tomentosa TaxID=118781 RepID=A0A8X8CVR1_POPTO|nr:hypothetical protein POTOM_026964 [Populus tomentosa]